MNFFIKCIICFLWLWIPAELCKMHAQSNAKGVRVSVGESNATRGKTYALIMGISKYKNPAIPSLQYADVDAIAFENYLLATGVNANDITLLINENATNGAFWTNISYLTETAKQGDRVFIYFSGHGDVENRTVVKDAYLLPYDAPKCVYPAGAIAIPLLKSWIATLSANGIQAIFIADACHSGNLAGGKEGMEAAASMLKDKWQDEIKMLSCQPGELSLEGNQWGGGRGLFSYVLISGLAGMADRNKDNHISLRELNLYMMEKVPEEAEPMPQNPLLSGDMEADIATVNPEVIAFISKQNSKQAPVKNAIDESLFVNLDDSIQQNCRLFQLYLDSNILLGLNNSPSAHLYAARIPKSESTKKLVAAMQQNLASAMLTEIHRVIESFLDNNFNPYSMTRKELIKVSREATIVRAYMGDSTLQSMGLLSRVLFGESMKGIFNSEGMNPDLVIEKLDSAISLDPSAAYCYLWKGLILHDKKNQSDLAIVELKKAISLSPKFLSPYLSLEEIYRERGMWDAAINALKQTLSFCQSLDIYHKLCINYNTVGKSDSAHIYLNRFLQLFSITYDNKENIPFKATNLMIIGNLYALLDKNYTSAIAYYDEAYQLDPSDFGALSFYNYACYYSMLNETDNALRMLESALKFGWNDYEWIMKDSDLDHIRNLPDFKNLIKKHFPDKKVE